MDRILLGKAPSGESGLWVSKPGVNVFAFAGNNYYDDAYGFNENFSWTGSNTYTHGWVSRDDVSDYSSQSKIETTSRGTILFNNNSATGDPYFIHVMNTNPNWTTTFERPFYRDHTEDTSFNGNTYPVLEFRVRRPLKSDGTHWQISDFDSRGVSTNIFRWFFATSNTTNDIRGITVPATGGNPTYNRSVGMNAAHWYDVMGTSGEWVTIEYDLANGTWQWQRDSGESASGDLRFDYHDWVSNTAVHMLRLDAFNDAQHPGQYPIHTRDDADLEIDYIRAKKRGVPINFGNSINDNFHFSSDWAATGLVHASGRVVLGNEYAWANGYSKDSGTSHPGSTSGRVQFDRLPYIPVVLFQRYDPNQSARATFPGGDKEFSVAHCDMTSNTPIWNPLTKKYQSSTNTAYGSEYRTFAYARAGYDHFDVTCRNAIARDGFEHLFNYTPQEPYVEIYKGGNYDPESENPETFVMYPQQVQNVHTLSDQASLAGPREDRAEAELLNPAAIDNGLFSFDFNDNERNIGRGEVGISSKDSLVVSNPPSDHAHSQPPIHKYTDKTSKALSGREGSSGFGISSTHGTEFYQNFGDTGVDGASHAAGRMKDGVLGLRRGKVITTDDLPSEGFDSSPEGAGGDFKQYAYRRNASTGNLEEAVYKLTGNPSASDDIKVLMDGGTGDPDATFNGKGPLGESVVNNTIYTADGLIGTDQYSSSEYQLDWSARDHADGKLGYFSRYTGTDKGNCLPTFDWANKFGDWNVPQFNNFYQYDPDIGAGSYTSFKDAIGTTWTANNTKFLDDSMWLGYANNRFEYKGDIWHPQAPTKTYDELSGVFGFGGTIAHQGDWHDFSGTPTQDYPSHGFVGSADQLWKLYRTESDAVSFIPDFSQRAAQKSLDYKAFPGHGYTGIHLISRYDSNLSFDTTHRTSTSGPFAVDIAFRNRYMYRPFNGVHAFSQHSEDVSSVTYLADRGADYQPDRGSSGPGTQATYGRIHDYGRSGMYSYTNPTYSSLPFDPEGSPNRVIWFLQDAENSIFTDYLDGIVSYGNNFKPYPRHWGYKSVLPPNKFWADLSSSVHGIGEFGDSYDMPWGLDHNEGEERSEWTLGIRYDRNAPPTDESATLTDVGVLPSITEQQTGQYGHKDSFVVSRWYTYPGATFSYDISNFSGPAHYDAWYKNDVLKETNDYKRKDYPQLYTGGWGNYGYFPTQEQLDQGKGATRLFAARTTPSPDSVSFSYEGSFSTGTGRGPSDENTIFKKRARYGTSGLAQATYDDGEAYVYFLPNSLHSDKQISRTFGIPNEIAGDYYVASRSHYERGGCPEVQGATPVNHVDPFHSAMGSIPAASLHTRSVAAPYYDVANGSHNISIISADGALDRGGLPYPDYKLIDYLRSKGIDVDTLEAGEAIPIKADPYFAGMAFYGTDLITGAFTAHRFEFKIKKTKTHINHFRQSYEYNLPGKSGHRAETLRPIGYGLMTNVSGFNENIGPAPAAHSYFDARQLGGGYPLWRDVGISVKDGNPLYEYFEGNVVVNAEYFSGSNPTNDARHFNIRRGHHDGTIADVRHPAFANTYFSNRGWGDHRNEVKYDNDIFLDPAKFDLLQEVPELSIDSIYETIVTGGIKVENLLGGYWNLYEDFNELAYQSVSMSRHGRDSMVNGIIGAVEVSNTYFADYKATYWDAGLKYWITGTAAVPSAPTNNDYYNLQRPLRYRPVKSQGASPETQMYGAYLNPPFNRHVDYHRAWAGLNSHWHSTGNHWEDDVLPGMCKADNALTNWGTVDLSKFDHNHIGYKWHNDAWHEFDNGSGIAESIVWAPSKSNQKWSDATSSTDKGQGDDPYQSLADPAITPETRRTQNQKGGTYDGFKLHERPEFQPVTGDGRYFGGVGGVDNWGGTSYNTWGPGMSVSPTVWDLKWTNIRHPLGVSPVESEDANTFYGATSIQNQTSLIGGAPNSRRVIGDDGGTFTYSDGSTGFGTPVFSDGTRLNRTTLDFGGYRDEDARGGTPKNYDWAIGGSQIQSNYWDRTLKVPHLGWEDNSTGRNLAHANNGIQPLVSLKVKGAYDASGGTFLILENNGLINDVSDFSDWLETDEIVLRKGSLESASSNLDRSYNAGTGEGQYSEGILIWQQSTFPGGSGGFGPVRMRLTTEIAPTGSDFYENPNTLSIDQNPQLVLYNKTLAEDTSRHPAGAFKANTTYHFQYMYDESKINPPEYIYWVLRIPASMDSYNGESLI
tara:strand:- start:29039 stop:35683 length:6645 start_codon:yes stop_codon:yes gene_type:complete